MERFVWLVSVTHMFLEVFFLVQVALIPVFVREFGLNLIEASLVATVPNLVQLFMNLPSGFLADRLAPNRLLLASMATEALSVFAISQTRSFWMLVLCVSVMKIASPIYHITGLSYISRVGKQEKISRSMGIHNALGSFGAAIGLVSLAFFQSTLGWRWNYIFWSVPIFIWGFILHRSSNLKMSETVKTKKGIPLKRLPFVLSVGFLILLAAVGLREVGNTGTSTFMTTYFIELRGFPEATASFVFGLGPFMGIAGSLSAGYLGEKIGAKKTLSIVIIGCITFLVALSLSSHIILLIFVYVVYSFFKNSVWSPINILVSDLTPKVGKGLGFSFYFLTEGIVVAITPIIAATIIDLSNIWSIFPFSIIFFVGGFVMLQFVSRKQRTVAS